MTGPVSRAAGTYTLGGLVGAITGAPYYGWDGSGETAFRGALQNTAFFGPTGTVTTTINTTNITSTASLSGLNGIAVPWWNNGSASPTQVNQVVAFFQAGGDLFMGNDDSSHDPVGTALGVPTLDDSGNAWTPRNYLSIGPFGSGGAGSVTTSGNYGYLSPTAVSSTGGIVGATDSSGNVTTAYWPRHAFCGTCGAMVIIADVDVWSTVGTYAPLNADGQFSLNAIAFLLGAPTVSAPPPTTPVPPSFWLGVLGLAGLAFYSTSRFGRRTAA